LGTTSIGWAYVHEAESETEKSIIKRLGVRVIPLTVDEESNFQKGKSITTNADRTLKRGMRRNLDRYQLRRKNLLDLIRQRGIVNNETILTETGKNSTFETLRLRARAAIERIELDEFARVLLMINKKRGYKSSRKAKDSDEGSLIDGMSVARQLYENNMTPGQFVFNLLRDGGKYIPDFYRSDLAAEFQKVWDFQKVFYLDIMTDDLKKELAGKNKTQSWSVCKDPFDLVGIKQNGKSHEKRLERYKWRSEALSKKLEPEILAIVIQDINGELSKSSGYLGDISDRSKELYFNNETVGQYLYKQVSANPHARLKNQVFYRQDYMDEFERIWETQRAFHPVLTAELKSEIRDVVIFYQRRLKSQKHLISECEFEKHHKVIPKSSPLFQEFKIRQIINNLELTEIGRRRKFVLNKEEKEVLFKDLNLRTSIKSDNALKLLGYDPKLFEMNYDELDGNRTFSALYSAYERILEIEGYEMKFSSMTDTDVNEAVKSVFRQTGIDEGILQFDSGLDGSDMFEQPIYQLWHLLYSFEDDNTKLHSKLEEKFGFKLEHAKILSNISLQQDHGNLSSRAIRKIMPFLKEGETYDKACEMAGYNHSSSMTAEERDNRDLKSSMEILPKNSLRNPVVEKILNQMVNLVNALIDDPELGKPDEVRVEMARELKKSAGEREEMTRNINSTKADHQRISEILQQEFGIKKVTRNDIIRYKLYRELEMNGFKTIYTNTYVPREKLFSKEFDIEHIIPQARLFDDSFSNKTLAVRQVNLDKGDETAYDFLKEFLSPDDFGQYLLRVEELYRKGKIGRAKYNKLLMKGIDIPDDFIERDLRNSQYIAKKAKMMLEEVCREVTTTTGSVTNRLRSDWQLVDVMKELNMPKYRQLGLTETIEGKDGREEERIMDWSKRNDHRHHAMDALTVAFTKRAQVPGITIMSLFTGMKKENFRRKLYPSSKLCTG